MHTIILISCPDQPGIIARFTEILYESSANILSLEQHVEENQWFFMRIHAELGDAGDPRSDLKSQLEALARDLGANLQMFDPNKPLRIAIFVSKEEACPRELLIANQAGLLNAEIVSVISNSPDMEGLAVAYSVPFHFVDTSVGMADAETTMLALLAQSRPDIIVLARYMKVLSPEFVAAFDNKIINIHHGFLPAFKGSKPYHQAWERGVKFIGATAHFVTADLDDGPIIAQEVMPVTHQHSVKEMIQAGSDIEKRVLLQAVHASVQHKIILHHRRTIIFH